MIDGFDKQRAFLWFALGACGVTLGCAAAKDHSDPNAGPANPALPGVGFGGSASAGSATNVAGGPSRNGGSANGGSANGGSAPEMPGDAGGGGSAPEGDLPDTSGGTGSGGTGNEEPPATAGTSSGGIGSGGTGSGGTSSGGAGGTGSGGNSSGGAGGTLGQGGQQNPPSLTAAITDLPATSSGSYTVKWKCTSAVCSNVFTLQEAPDTQFTAPTSFSYQGGETSRSFVRKAAGKYCYRVSVGGGSNWSEARCTTVTAPVPACDLGATRCVAGDIQGVETCGEAGWVRSTCGEREMCSNKACHTVCGLTSAPASPAICLVPNNDGVNNGEWALWTDSKLAVPTYADGGTQPTASRYTASGQTWPYAWSISSSSMAYVDFKLKQFGGTRKQRLSFRAKRSGIITGNSNNYTIGIFDSKANMVASCILGPVPYAWGNGYCLNGSPYNAQLDYAGGLNTMALSITGDGFGGAIDLLDVNWLLLTIEP